MGRAKERWLYLVAKSMGLPSMVQLTGLQLVRVSLLLTTVVDTSFWASWTKCISMSIAIVCWVSNCYVGLSCGSGVLFGVSGLLAATFLDLFLGVPATVPP